MLQILETTKEDKVKMYNKLSKKELIEMLIEANMHLDRLTQPSKYLLCGAEKPLHY